MVNFPFNIAKQLGTGRYVFVEVGGEGGRTYDSRILG